jgi:hypothetical protein
MITELIPLNGVRREPIIVADERSTCGDGWRLPRHEG